MVGDYAEVPGTKSRTKDDWEDEVRDILLGEGSLEFAGFEEFKKAFDDCELKRKLSDERKEFAAAEAFILEEQNLGREQRKRVRVLQASEEVRMAAEIAQLKGVRLRNDIGDREAELQNKISDTERAYLQRKMVVAKATQLASGECRAQLSRTKSFFRSLHLSRLTALRHSYERSLKLMAIKHRLSHTDPRAAALENNCAERMYRKKEANLNELHMAQNLEEATYLESMIELLDQVQAAKETAAKELFHLHVEDLKNCKETNARRRQQFHDLREEIIQEMAKMVAHYTEEQNLNNEDDFKTADNVAMMERKKDFDSHPLTAIASVSELYDTIIWPVATSHFSLVASESTTYTDSVFSDDSDGEDENDAGEGGEIEEDIDDPEDWQNDGKRLNDDGSLVSGSSANTTESEHNSLSVLGKIHVNRLKKSLKLKEKALLKKHNVEVKQERQRYRKLSRKLKMQHEQNIDMLLRKCVEERHRLREGITQRMTALAENQELATNTLQESIERDIKAMQDAWAEQKRLEDAEKKSFDKAQALISAQVFHEVRNALSSIIAMNEMTSTLQEDEAITPLQLSEMLDQGEEVVRYSLQMLNNILDINKIKTGSFETKERPFDLADLIQRATTMQLVKAQARGVKMSFKPPSAPCIAYTDEDILMRIVTNFISNAVKFTSSGAIQPFILPVDEIMSGTDPRQSPLEVNRPSLQGRQLSLVAVGVADTGCGLSQDMLKKAEAGLYKSNDEKTSSGAKNSGFGLHLAHQLAGTLGTRLYLADVSHCHVILNEDISAAFKHHQSSIATTKDKSGGLFGTVLFVVIPIFEQDHNRDSSLKPNPLDAFAKNRDSPVLTEMLLYRFNPQSVEESTNGCFRILVADDVLMLRKGLVRSILQVFEQFTNCCVSIHTACTAEDALRLVSSQPFDIVISDNQFAQPNDLKPLKTNKSRPHILYDRKSKKLQQNMSNFFLSESFTIEKGDGELSGLQALLQMLESSKEFHPMPILILLSGHKFQLDPTCGVIVAQKPLRTSELVPLLEAHAEKLIDWGLCIEEEDKSDGKCCVVNQRGTQIFVKNY